jgi:hypothetical protein
MTLPEITENVEQAREYLRTNQGMDAAALADEIGEVERLVRDMLDRYHPTGGPGWASERIREIGEELDDAHAQIAELEAEVAELREQLESQDNREPGQPA